MSAHTAVGSVPAFPMGDVLGEGQTDTAGCQRANLLRQIQKKIGVGHLPQTFRTLCQHRSSLSSACTWSGSAGAAVALVPRQGLCLPLLRLGPVAPALYCLEGVVLGGTLLR